MEKTLGIRILTGVTLEEIKADDRGVRGRAGQEKLEAELLLVALGRKPVTSSLKLENAGLTANKRGFLDVDSYGRTNVATIYAVGDVTGGPLLAHTATSQGLVAAENACGRYQHKNETVVPNCIFTTPEIGTVGLGEQEAQQQGRKIKTGKYLMGALGKALAIGEPIGFVKWVADAETDQLLGAHAIGPHATDIIAEAAVAIRAELTAADLGRTIHAHPTLAEAWMEAAHVLLGEPIHSAPPRKSS
jgi:dihydrolipoamide dehydrogenase